MTGYEVGLDMRQYLAMTRAHDAAWAEFLESVMVGAASPKPQSREEIAARWVEIGAPDGCTEVAW